MMDAIAILKGRSVAKKNDAATRSSQDMYFVLLLLALSGYLTITRMFNIDIVLVGTVLLLAFFMTSKGAALITPHLLVVFGIFGVILLVQCIIFSFWPFVTIAGFYARVFVGYAVMRLVKNFPYIYVRAMYLLAVISLFFYVPCELALYSGYNPIPLLTAIGESIGTADTIRLPLIFHTFMQNQMHRNAGVFWEGGAFAGYLIIALAFLAFVRKDLSRVMYRRCFIVLSVVLFTTQSTTGYVAYPLTLILHYDFKSKHLTTRLGRLLLVVYVLLPLLIVGSLTAYIQLPFLMKKIDVQNQNANESGAGWYTTRQGSLAFDWQYIESRPLTGWGLNPRTRYGLNPYDDPKTFAGMGNGFSDFIAKLGIIAFFIFVTSTYYCIYKYCDDNHMKGLIFITILLLILQGECYFEYPLFFGLMFINSLQPESIETKPTRKIRICW